MQSKEQRKIVSNKDEKKKKTRKKQHTLEETWKETRDTYVKNVLKKIEKIIKSKKITLHISYAWNDFFPTDRFRFL